MKRGTRKTVDEQVRCIQLSTKPTHEASLEKSIDNVPKHNKIAANNNNNNNNNNKAVTTTVISQDIMMYFSTLI
jgi:hypothetical protein